NVCAIIFFFQAEDGIRDATVTGVQTCALPISAAACTAAACTAAATSFACRIAHPGGRQTAGLDSGWWLLPMAARIRGHLRLDTVCRVRPSDSARIGRALDRGEHPSAVQVPQ